MYFQGNRGDMKLQKNFIFIVLCLLLGSMVVTAQDSRELTIIHTSGLYDHFEEFTPWQQTAQGGAPRLATAIGELRADHENSLLVSSGRDIVGTRIFAQYGGVVAADLMTQLG
jgi:2',3'-cyclic-nucleotide 2'-phosphodiesterase (5'-nucleotidase family)